MTTTPRPTAAILAAVTQGATISDLLARWPLNDVAETLHTYHLVVGEHGRIVNPDEGPPQAGRRAERARLLGQVLELAHRSPEVRIRRAAEQAAERLRRLTEVLDAEQAEFRRTETEDTLLAMQIEAQQRWREWLKDATRQTSTEIELLKKRRDARAGRRKEREDRRLRDAA